MTGWEVDIQEDKTAAQVMESKTAEAAHSLAGVLGISEEDAQKLASSGMVSIEAVQTATADDIAEILGLDNEAGQKILDAALASTEEKPAAA